MKYTDMKLCLKMRAMNNGRDTKPRERSDTARLKSNVFIGFGREDVLHKAWIAKLFNTIAVQGEKAFKALLTIPVFVVDNVSLISVILYQAARGAMRI